jgi:glycosyltransferase involved in cell wall biosynthesis
LNTGGAERALYNVLAGGLAEAEHFVLSLQGEGTYGSRIRALGVPVYTLDMLGGLPGPRALWRLRQVVRGVRPDIIQGWMYHGNLAASMAARMTPGLRPAVAWNVRHSLYSLAAEKRLTRQVIRANRWASAGADAIIYNSRLSRKQHEGFGIAASRGQVIPNGFDTDQLRPDAECGRATRKALEIPSRATVIGHVARFHPIKDHASFLRAVVDVMSRHADVVCLMVGREVNLENPALAGVVPPELEGRFRFAGERNDVPNLMRAMEVLCQSSWSEAFPNVLGEAMALGVPCVATDVGDSRDIVGDTGEVVPPSDSKALANGLLAMLGRPAEERAALGRAARVRIEERYDLPQVLEQYSTLYSKLVSE